MSILNKYKRWVPLLLPISDEYWDFVLSQDDSPSSIVNGELSDKCLISYINFGDALCQNKNGVNSYPEYSWDECVNDGAMLTDIGFTGIDNGLIDYGGYDRVTNKEFYDIFVNSKIEITSGDCRFYMHKVTGNTGVYSYDSEYVEDKYYALKGGFFQGFYKLYGFNYQVLPNTIENEWNVEIELRPRNYDEADNTLNSTHPENKGIFFFMGTRAEDKFLQIYNSDLSKYEDRVQPSREYCDGDYFDWDHLPEELVNAAEKANKLNKKINITKAFNLTYFLNTYGYNWDGSCKCRICEKIDGDDTEEDKKTPCDRYLIDPDYYETDISIEDEKITTSNGAPVEDSGYYEIKTDNKFITFNRTKYGFTTSNWDEDTLVVLTGSTNDIRTGNLFLLMNRTKSGYTTETIDKYYSDNKKEFNFTSDTLGNAFALKCDSDGSIGYRYLVKDCDSGSTVIEEKSFSGLVKENEWATINVKFSILNGDVNSCGKPNGQRKMKICIYVNGMLKFISKELPEFNFRELSTIPEKQEGVPFNISVGGGTQGLCDSVWLDYRKAFEKILPIEKNFAGTFIGDIRNFRFYSCKLSLTDIRNNSLYNIKTRHD